MKYALLGAAALAATVGTAQAATYTYDFKAEANASGQIGESIFSTFQTSDTNGILATPVFAGPNLEVTATKGGNAAFVYFDNGDAGMGVCGVASNAGQVGQYGGGSDNRCNPGSDDGLTTTGEALHFKATEQAVKITSFFINSNHDAMSILLTAWNIGGTVYDVSDLGLTEDAGGDVEIVVNYTLKLGETLDLFGVEGPNSYISAIGVAPVPVPAAGLLLLGGLGALGAIRKRKQKAA